MQNKHFVSIGLLSLLFVSTSSIAAMMSIPYGWYVEFNVGVMNVTEESFPGSSKSTSGGGANLSLGYKFMPFFGTEVGYTQFSSTTIQNGSGTTAGEINRYVIDLAMKAIVPVTDTGFEFFAKVGADWIRSHFSISNSTAAASIGVTSSTRTTASGFFFAFGGQYYFMPEFSVNVQWSQARGSNSTGTFNFLSAGVNLIFA